MNHDVTSLDYWLSQAQLGDAVACYNAGLIFQEQANISAAIQYYEKAIYLNPVLVEAYNNLGGIYKSNDELDKALGCYLKALNINPDNANINNNIGVILQSQKNFKDALRFLKKALYLDPYCETTYYNMGLIFEDQLQLSEAAYYFEKAYSLNPKSMAVSYWSSEMAHIQQLCLKEKNSKLAISKMKSLFSWAMDQSIVGEQVVGISPPFYLTYREYNNVDFFSSYGDICVALMAYLQIPTISSENKSKKIRLGIISDNFHSHSVWHAVLKGWYQYLDKNKFEIYSFNLGKKKDVEYELVKKQSDYFIEGNYNTPQWRDMVLAQQLDLLIFPAIGMNWKIQQLASLRMAPIQLTTWGHPETSGLPTIDYYLSGDDFEPTNAQENYREKLFKLPNLGSCYKPLSLFSDQFDVAELGITPDTCLLIVPGMPFKFEQQYDHVFAEIATRIKNAKIIFFKSKPDGVSEAFENRIKNTFLAKGLNIEDHAIFIPAMRKARFHALMRHSHVYLDTIGFSGFNTAMQSIECDLPIITYEGKFMRGRFASAILRKMGLEELISHSTKDYIENAVKIVMDENFRKSIKNKIIIKKYSLYSDMSVIKKLEDFIESIARK